MLSIKKCLVLMRKFSYWVAEIQKWKNEAPFSTAVLLIKTCDCTWFLKEIWKYKNHHHIQKGVNHSINASWKVNHLHFCFYSLSSWLTVYGTILWHMRQIQCDRIQVLYFRILRNLIVYVRYLEQALSNIHKFLGTFMMEIGNLC